jgi:hypothetical protein
VCTLEGPSVKSGGDWHQRMLKSLIPARCDYRRHRPEIVDDRPGDDQANAQSPVRANVPRAGGHPRRGLRHRSPRVASRPSILPPSPSCSTIPTGEPHLIAASSEQARLTELFQLQNVEGRCLEAFAFGIPGCHTDLRAAIGRRSSGGHGSPLSPSAPDTGRCTRCRCDFAATSSGH